MPRASPGRYDQQMTGTVESVNTSRGGVPKVSALEALITAHGVGGDAQDDLQHHGGPERAVVLFSLDLIRALQAEGHPIAPGTTGENLTLSGLDWASICPGATLRVGDVRLEIMREAPPCQKIAGSFKGRHFTRISHKEHPGWSRLCARVLTGGIVRPGDQVSVEVAGAGASVHGV